MSEKDVPAPEQTGVTLHSQLRVVAEVLDDLDVGTCVFNAADEAMVWNRTFLRFFPDHKGEGFAVHYLDLDAFKAVNDTHGHATGDRLLATVASRMRAIARDADVVARMGGDEFAILQLGGGRP